VRPRADGPAGPGRPLVGVRHKGVSLRPHPDRSSVSLIRSLPASRRIFPEMARTIEPQPCRRERQARQGPGQLCDPGAA
jgi:hypothetical protein